MSARATSCSRSSVLPLAQADLCVIRSRGPVLSFSMLYCRAPPWPNASRWSIRRRRFPSAPALFSPHPKNTSRATGAPFSASVYNLFSPTARRLPHGGAPIRNGLEAGGKESGEEQKGRFQRKRNLRWKGRGRGARNKRAGEEGRSAGAGRQALER